MFSWAWNWIKGVLKSWGWMNKSGQVIFLGLDGAGKTTLLGLLKDGKIIPQEPTNHPVMETFTVENLTISAYDMGGHREVRYLWKEYALNATAVIFIVDVFNRARIQEAREELESVLAEERMRQVPILILGNKIDIPNSMGENELKQELGIRSLCTGKQTGNVRNARPLEVFMCSMAKGRGYGDGMRWLNQFF
ncbi:MAG: putative GTP-binding protein SAR1 [Streblomastix strix]|uniref:Putative GTP-binding protein SAR1 n=1 Tax=Streblomastix strix TaxID=222440 RepID=A0A5J4VHR4_9EUKA|nr:MAG: putative GTP-binding protein SAR1 [Streblomastix strix]